MVDPLVVGQHKDNQVLFILAYSLFMIQEIIEWIDVLKVLTTNEYGDLDLQGQCQWWIPW